MGRRIPKRNKQKKIKFVDPFYTGPTPILKKGKRNLLPDEPPTQENEQKMSRNMEAFIELRNKVKQNEFKCERKRKKVPKDDFILVRNHIVDTEEPGMERKVKAIPAVMKQEKFESEQQFFNRIQRMVDTAVTDVKVEEKYNIELKSIDEEGNAEFIPASEEDKERKRKKRKKLVVRQKKKLKKEEDEFNLKKERILFGDVASRPPVFTSKLKKAPEFEKAGKRQLLLKNMLPSNTELKEKKVAPLSRKRENMQPKLKFKKDLEDERLRIVQLYRMMKSKKAS